MHPTKTASRMDGPRLLTTAAGQQRTASRLNKVRDAYDAVCASNGAAAEAGDNSVWHDNFDYEENQRQMHQLARRFRDLEDAMRRIRKAGKAAGYLTPLEADARRMIAAGTNFCAVGADVGILARGAEALCAKFKS